MVRAGPGRRWSLWVAPLLLVGVAVIGIAGRVAPAVRPAPRGSAAVAGPSAVDVVAVLPPSSGPRAALGVPYQHAREEGTDGLMGGIPFGLPADSPLVRLDRINRFTIDDVALGWSGGSSFPTRVHRIGGLPSYATDPRAR